MNIDESIKITNIGFFGFSRQETRAIKRYIRKHNISEYSFDFVQDISDKLERDIGTLIEPGGKVTLLRL